MDVHKSAFKITTTSFGDMCILCLKYKLVDAPVASKGSFQRCRKTEKV